MRCRLLAVALALTVVACAREPRGDDDAQRGGSLVIASPGDADVLLPPVAATQLAAQVCQRIFLRLAELTPSLNTVDDSGFVPVLAESWERRDSLTLAFRLDPRAQWQDGQPVTADDVAFTFDVYRDTLVASPYRSNLDGIESVSRENERTVVFRFHRSYPEQLYDATYHLLVLPRHLLDTIPRARLASSAFARTPTGSGPFRFARWVSGAEIVLEADTAHFRGAPALARIVWRVMPDVSAAVTALLAGQADAMEVIPQRDEIERVSRSTDLRLMPYPSPFLGGLAFNLRRPPFGDRALRRALAMAVDRATIVRSVFGPYGDAPVGSTTRVQWIAGMDVRQLPFDTAAARSLLDSLGWRDRDGDGIRERAGRPLRLSLLAPTTSRIRQQVAVLLQDQLRRVGVDVRIQALEFSVFDARTRAGDFDAMLFSWTLDPSPGIIAQFWGPRSPDNLTGYRSAPFDSAFAAAASSRTRAEAEGHWRSVLELLNEDAPAVFIYSPRNQAAVHARFENVSIRPDNWLASVADWRVPPDRRLPRDR